MLNPAIQQLIKEQIKDLLSEYDVSYLDYDAKEDEYSIRLFKFDNERG